MLFLILKVLFFFVVTALVAKAKKRFWPGWGFAGLVCAFIPIVGIVAWVVLIIFLALKGGEASGSIPNIPDFTPEYQSVNIAIDTSRNKIWARDASGQSKVFDKSDITRWSKDGIAVSRSRGDPYNAKCAIVLHVRDMSRPMWRVLFNRHGHTWVASERKNSAEMEEWYSRLTTFING